MLTKIKIDKDMVLGKVEKGIFGSFVEHLGRGIYTGIYQKDHVTADENGFRGDVMELVKDLHISYLRWPGGNFVSGYDWKDAVGPFSERKVRPDPAWIQLEPNQVGPAEFAKYCSLVGSEVMMAVNLGTGTEKDAYELLEYCNFDKGTYYSDLRRKHGCEKPFKIKKWCLGNEMDGSWQICTHTADEYGRKAQETAKLMKWLDPTVELIVTGSSGWLMPSCPEWDRKVLEYTYEHIDYISLHRYYCCENKNDPKRLTDFLCSCNDMDAYINAIVTTADYVKALKRGKKDIMLSFDEYNVWCQQKVNEYEKPWTIAPRREEMIYDHCDALVFASMLMTIIKHCDRVKLACVAQLINALGMILTEPEKNGGCYLQTIAYPFILLQNCSENYLVQSRVYGEKLISEQYGETDCVNTLTVYDEENEELKIFALNLTAETSAVEVDASSFGRDLILRKEVVYSGNLFDQNTFENKYACHIKEEMQDKLFKNGLGSVDILGYSLTMFLFGCEK